MKKTDIEALTNNVHHSNDDDSDIADYVDPDVAVFTPHRLVTNYRARICAGVNKRTT